MADKNFQQEIMKQSLLTDGHELKDFFTKEDYEKLNQFFKDSIKAPLEMFSKLKPVAVMSFILLRYMDCGGEMPTGYENWLISFAEEKNIPVSGLESIEGQFKIFDNMPKDSIAKMVLIAITDVSKNRVALQSMLNAYSAQDLSGLYEFITSSPEYASQINDLLYNRNKKWIPAIIKAANEKPTFFAVGAAHLPGEYGVLHLLREQGYKISPVK